MVEGEGRIPPVGGPPGGFLFDRTGKAMPRSLTRKPPGVGFLIFLTYILIA